MLNAIGAWSCQSSSGVILKARSSFGRFVGTTLRARLNHAHVEPAISGVDRGSRLRTSHRSPARSPYSSCPHPGDERRQLPTQAKPPQTRLLTRSLNPAFRRGSGTEGLYRYAPEPLRPRNTPKPTPNHWPTFTPPHWPGFAPPLTHASSNR
jgi:hypothetical protein